MRQLFTITFVLTAIVSLGGWFWLLADLLRWLIIKI
jgi:hypothetical protein